jgi:hypothetical protein
MKASWMRDAALAAAAACLACAAAAQTGVTMPPNLIPLPASNISLVTDGAGQSLLRLATTGWNAGTGPLELVAGEVVTGSDPPKQKVYQRVYVNGGAPVLSYAGSFTYHAGHNHIHFDDYATYSLQPVNAPGGSERLGTKTTFCVMDTNKINGALPGAPSGAVYSTCGNQIQGISVGWGDTYGAHLAGQEIDFTDNADGVYRLRIELDPKKLIVESNENDNVSCVLLNIRKPSSVTVLDASGSCSAVSSITPNAARIGQTVQVTISGYGFAQGMAVGFEGGNGPRPEVSNVVLASDSDTVDLITATVTVPAKRKGGRDPVWNLRVGTSVLPDAFTVQP